MSIQEPWEFEYKRRRRAKSVLPAVGRERPIWQILYDEVVQLTERTERGERPPGVGATEDATCDHEFTKVYDGMYKLCEKCNELRGPFKTLDYGFNDYERIHFKNTGPDRTKEVRDTFREMLLSLSLSPSHVDELCLIYEKYESDHTEPRGDAREDPVKCRTGSLCAAILRSTATQGQQGPPCSRWMSDKMSLREFSEKCGVSKRTITKVCKQLDNK